MFKRHLSLLLAVASLATMILAGCGGGSRESALIGEWEVRDGSGSGAGVKAFDDPDKLRSNLATMMKQDLSLKDDKTFAMTGTMEASGTWAFDAESSALTLTPTGGGTPMKAELSEGNQQVSFANPTGSGPPVVLQKKDAE